MPAEDPAAVPAAPGVTATIRLTGYRGGAPGERARSIYRAQAGLLAGAVLYAFPEARGVTAGQVAAPDDVPARPSASQQA